jgi:hypothetical protein
MRKIGITCAKSDEIKCHSKQLKEKSCEGCQQVAV